MTGPMFQVGWASACSGVTSASSSRLRCRNGPPLAVTTSLLTSCGAPAAQALRDRRVLASRPGRSGPARPGPATSWPPMISDSLLASASTRPASSAASVAARPDRAGDRVQHDVAGPGGHLGDRVRARPGSSAAAGPARRLPERPAAAPGAAALPARWPRPRPRPRTPAPGWPAGPGCRRRPPARPAGTGPGCAGRCRPPGSRSTRSSRAGRCHAWGRPRQAGGSAPSRHCLPRARRPDRVLGTLLGRLTPARAPPPAPGRRASHRSPAAPGPRCAAFGDIWTASCRAIVPAGHGQAEVPRC